MWGLTIGISSLIIISCISAGFSEMINNKISGIDGHIRIQNYINKEIPSYQIVKLDSTIWDISDAVISSSQFIEKYLLF